MIRLRARRFDRPQRHRLRRLARGLPKPRFTARFWFAVSGALSLIWLLLRSGTKPSRIGYPCQQAAASASLIAFGVPAATAAAATGRTVLQPLRRRGVASALGLTVTIGAVGWLAWTSLKAAAPMRILSPPADYRADVFLINDARGPEPGRFGGVDDLVTLMGMHGFKWHRSALVGPTAGPDGMIDPDDIVIIKVNAQWSQRGGSNTDVLRGVIRRIVEHPDGFVGEIIVADNGQGGGNLNRSENNAEDHGQSAKDVVLDFAAEGWLVDAMLWDPLRYTSVSEYADGNLTDGYVVNPIVDAETGMRTSYPKFRTTFGSYVSYKNGVWEPDTQIYRSNGLVVINLPVLKTHSIYGITAAVKNHMGVVTRNLSTDSHNAVGRGGMGSLLADIRQPDLTILDCIWVLARPGSGPAASYTAVSRLDKLVASPDPVALDVWAAKYVLMPQILANGYAYGSYHNTQDPDNPDSVFRRYLDRSMNEMLLARIDTTNDPASVNLFVSTGEPIPTISQWGAVVLMLLLLTGGTYIGRQRRCAR